MSFVDTLRNARRGATPLVHEFKVNYDGGNRRVHAFVEGYEDLVFYRPLLQGAAGGDCKVFMYRCGNKKMVYDLFSTITSATPITRGVLFFVDKDLSDLLGEEWPRDDRISVTDVYSIENYLVCRTTFERFCLDLIRLRKIEFTFEQIFDHFEVQMLSFQRQALILMAWILAARSLGLKPNLNNINLDQIFTMSEDCSVHRSLNIASYLARSTGAEIPAQSFGRILIQRRAINARQPKEVIRGKFETWFFVTFANTFIRQLNTVAEEVGGAVGLRIHLNLSNVVETFTGRFQTPSAIQTFLNRHFPQQMEML